MVSWLNKRVVFLIGLLVALLFLWQLVQAPWFFSINEIVIRGTSFLDSHQVIETAGVDYGQSLLRIKPSEVERRLLSNPWVSSARVDRRFPHTLSIDIVERQAAVVIPYYTAFVVVAWDGTVLDIRDNFATINLPIVTGFQIQEVDIGTSLTSSKWHTVVNCLEHIPASFRWQVSEICLLEGGAMQLYTLDGTKVYLGKVADFRWDKLLLLPEIFDRLTPEGDDYYLDLTTVYAVYRKSSKKNGQ